MAMISLVGLGTVLVSIIAWLGPREARVTDLVIYILVLNGIEGLAVALWRRQLLASQAGRLATGGLAVGTLGILAHRLLSLHLGTSVSEVLMGDMGLLTCLLVFSAFIIPGWLWGGLILATVNAAGVVMTVVRPDQAVPSASWSAILSFATLVYVGYRQIKQR
jgi:hypothetical protein